MDRERFKTLRRRIILFAGIIWVIIFFNIASQITNFWDIKGFLVTVAFGLTCGFPFVGGHYLAKAMARSEKEAKAEEQSQKDKRLAREQEEEEIRADRQRTLTKHRTLILENLDSADAFIDLFFNPAYQDQKAMAKQKFTNALLAIITIPRADLEEVIRANEEIQLKVLQLSTRLKERSIEDAYVAIMVKAMEGGGSLVSGQGSRRL